MPIKQFPISLPTQLLATTTVISFKNLATLDNLYKWNYIVLAFFDWLI